MVLFSCPVTHLCPPGMEGTYVLHVSPTSCLRSGELGRCRRHKFKFQPCSEMSSLMEWKLHSRRRVWPGLNVAMEVGPKGM